MPVHPHVIAPSRNRERPTSAARRVGRVLENSLAARRRRCLGGAVLSGMVPGLVVRESSAIHRRRDALTYSYLSGSMVGGHGGFDEGKTVTATTTKRAEESWDVFADKELEPGEYLLTTGISPQGFDFAIQLRAAKVTGPEPRSGLTSAIHCPTRGDGASAPERASQVNSIRAYL
jgi:hypothetical protein